MNNRSLDVHARKQLIYTSPFETSSIAHYEYSAESDNEHTIIVIYEASI